MKCSVSLQGSLRDCRILSETPPGNGFGMAALTLAPLFHIRPVMVGGAPADGGQIIIPMAFRPNAAYGHTINGAGPYLAYPTVAEMQRAYPRRALRKRMEGHVRIKCAVNVSTELEGCIVLSETPPGEGFGAAALALAPSFRVGPQRIDGVATNGGSIIIPIAFKAN